MRNHYEAQLRLFEKGFEVYYKRFKAAGAEHAAEYFQNPMLDYHETSLDVFLASHAARGYYYPDTKYTGDEFLLDTAIGLFERYRKSIHSDGSTDLRQTNFHDPAQVGFIVRDHISVIDLASRFSHHSEKEERLFALLLDILKVHGEAMVNLGFHTPNHRWVISSALSIAYKYTGDKRFLDTINRFLMEGVDCDEYGEYTERSTGVYNLICNKSFIVLGTFLGDESFFVYPVRNMKLMLSYFEPDNTICSLNSSRQDKNMRRPANIYYHIFAFLALQQKDPVFAWYADKMLEADEMKSALGEATGNSEILDMLIAKPDIIDNYRDIEPQAPCADRDIFLPNSGIARCYRQNGNMTVTVIKQRQPVFLQLQYGAHVVQLRFAGAFFGDPHSQFRATEIIKTEKGYRLVDDELAGYRSQLDEKPETSDWHRMDHSRRKIINIQEFCTAMDIEILDDGIALEIESSSCEGILTKLETVFEPGGRYDTEDTAAITRAGDYVLLKKGGASYTFADHASFMLDGGFYAHSYAKDMRGAAPTDQSGFTVVMTASTPQKNRLEIRIGRDGYRKFACGDAK